LVFQIAVAKLLSPPHFATYAVLLATLTAGERALSLGIDRTILRFVPALMRENDLVGARALMSRVGLLRAAALFTFVVLGFFGARSLNSILPIQLSTGALFAFGVWFIAYTFTIDTDAFAQSHLAHYNSALGSTMEIIGRIALLFVIWRFEALNVENIVTISAITSTCAVTFIVYRLRGFIRPLMRTNLTVSSHADTTFDPTHGPMFALANYASTVSYLISSPPVIRIIATAGLDINALAAFSFAQGLCLSLSRIFPGLLMIQTVEPIVMSRLAGDIRGDRVNAGLSILFKTELIFILSAVIVTFIAGADIVVILSRPTYAPYYYVLPVLIGSLALYTSYRLFELVANSHYKQHIFFWLWPLSVLAMLAMYATMRGWGMLSVLIWPIAEMVVRICLLTFMLRRYAVWRAFDPPCSALLILSAGTVVIFLSVLRTILPIHVHYSDLILAGLGLILFLVSLFIIRPIRPTEYEIIVAAIPAPLAILRRIALIITRRQQLKEM
jgi:hypothetical protein